VHRGKERAEADRARENRERGNTGGEDKKCGSTFPEDTVWDGNTVAKVGRITLGKKTIGKTRKRSIVGFRSGEQNFKNRGVELGKPPKWTLGGSRRKVSRKSWDPSPREGSLNNINTGERGGISTKKKWDGRKGEQIPLTRSRGGNIGSSEGS